MGEPVAMKAMVCAQLTHSGSYHLRHVQSYCTNMIPHGINHLFFFQNFPVSNGGANRYGQYCYAGLQYMA